MASMTRRTALGAFGSLVGLGLAGVITLVPTQAKKHRKKRKKGGKGGNNNPDNNPGNPNPGGNNPPPVPQFETVTRTFSFDDAVGIDTEGPVKQYPSEIIVSGLEGGSISKVTVRIPGFQHDFPDDVDMLLVGPQGQDVLLMSDVGGNQTGTVLFDLTFDDTAASDLPDEGPMTNGAFRPTNIGPDDDFEAPALPPSGNTSLAGFNGTDPSGTWSLFIMDDSPDDGGVLIGGWSLTITAQIPA